VTKNNLSQRIKEMLRLPNKALRNTTCKPETDTTETALRSIRIVTQAESPASKTASQIVWQNQSIEKPPGETAKTHPRIDKIEWRGGGSSIFVEAGLAIKKYKHKLIRVRGVVQQHPKWGIKILADSPRMIKVVNGTQ